MTVKGKVSKATKNITVKIIPSHLARDQATEETHNSTKKVTKTQPNQNTPKPNNNSETPIQSIMQKIQNQNGKQKWLWFLSV